MGEYNYQTTVEFKPKDDMAYERFHRAVEAIKNYFIKELKMFREGKVLTVILKNDVLGDFYLRASILGRYPKIKIKAKSRKRARECLGKSLCFLAAED